MMAMAPLQWNDFPEPSALLASSDHRPWPLPDGPWVMSQSWHDLLFAHWRVDTQLLRRVVPAQLPLDMFGGAAWLGVVPFHMTNVAPRLVPEVPPLSRLIELNVRTYVVIDGKPGVYFFSLDANSRLAVAGARALFRLPYFFATMETARDGEAITHRSRRARGTPAEWAARYRPSGLTRHAAPGSLEHFLTERYCLYTTDGDRVLRCDIHHPPWKLEDATATIDVNTMAAAAGLAVEGEPLLHCSRRQDVLVWPLESVRGL
jgi:uncharacterized protein YqjF (DUF2071 family)